MMEVAMETKICSFCLRGPCPDYGTFFTNEEAKISVHQYCMFFASGLPQNGDDKEGFDGFLMCDIIKEVRRGKRLKCSFCHIGGATIGCCVVNCKIKYHYPCGLGNGTLQQFSGCFDAYCRRHKPTQNILSKCPIMKVTCGICMEDSTDDKANDDFLKMPCCKESYFHRECLQKHALSSGYFFKCPTCNNGKEFIAEMRTYGIYIPERDALWEDGNTYADLLEVYNHCDAKYCYCPNGRTFNRLSGRWKLYRCEVCGQAASHGLCAETQNKPISPYHCDFCILAEYKRKYRNMLKASKECAVHVSDFMLERKKCDVPHTGGLGMNGICQVSFYSKRKRIEESCNARTGEFNPKTKLLSKEIHGRKRNTSHSIRTRAELKQTFLKEKLDMVQKNGNDLGKENNLRQKCTTKRTGAKRGPRPKQFSSLGKTLSKRKQYNMSKNSLFSCEGLRNNQSEEKLQIKCALHEYLESALCQV